MTSNSSFLIEFLRKRGFINDYEMEVVKGYIITIIIVIKNKKLNFLLDFNFHKKH